MEKKKRALIDRYNSLTKYRHENKYLIDARQEALLMFKAMGILDRDPYASDDGSYLVRSVYFEDIFDTCLTENLNGVDPRSKFRIRYYNSDTDHIVLEKKCKKQGLCKKYSCVITREECETFLRGKVPRITGTMESKKKKLFTEIQLEGLTPRVIVTYERIPFIYDGGNVRVTFDRNLTSSEEIKKFLTGKYAERPILETGQRILEMKWDEVMPVFIKDVLKVENLTWTAFSKYYMCRMFHL